MAGRVLVSLALAFVLSCPWVASTAAAHCDTMDGPVVKDAKAALEAGDLRTASKWVAPEKEEELRRAFDDALAVRKLGPRARDLADRAFFETLVRLHREGEQAPYTGLKPAGHPVDPAVAAADEALAAGSADGLVRTMTAAVERGIRQRFERARKTQAHVGESPEAGREFVAAYVRFTHYAERVAAAAAEEPVEGGHETHH